MTTPLGSEQMEFCSDIWSMIEVLLKLFTWVDKEWQIKKNSEEKTAVNLLAIKKDLEWVEKKISHQLSKNTFK